MPPITWNDFIKILGGLVTVAIGAADLFYFSKMGQSADVTFIVGGLAIFGVSVTAPSAFKAGVSAGVQATHQALALQANRNSGTVAPKDVASK